MSRREDDHPVQDEAQRAHYYNSHRRIQRRGGHISEPDHDRLGCRGAEDHPELVEALPLQQRCHHLRCRLH